MPTPRGGPRPIASPHAFGSRIASHRRSEGEVPGLPIRCLKSQVLRSKSQGVQGWFGSKCVCNQFSASLAPTKTSTKVAEPGITLHQVSLHVEVGFIPAWMQSCLLRYGDVFRHETLPHGSRSSPTEPGWYDWIYIPNTPWDCHLCRSVGVVLGVNVGIYGSPMECLGYMVGVFWNATHLKRSNGPSWDPGPGLLKV